MTDVSSLIQTEYLWLPWTSIQILPVVQLWFLSLLVASTNPFKTKDFNGGCDQTSCPPAVFAVLIHLFSSSTHGSNSWEHFQPDQNKSA